MYHKSCSGATPGLSEASNLPINPHRKCCDASNRAAEGTSMKDSREYWIRDIEQLLDETIVKDAVAELIGKLDEAIAALPAQSKELITKHFDGASVDQLSLANQVSPSEMQALIDQAKRELAQCLRARCLVKQ
jgi:DNA-directed RNA polymerase specialized sigma24 family protein